MPEIRETIDENHPLYAMLVSVESQSGSDTEAEAVPQ